MTSDKNKYFKDTLFVTTAGQRISNTIDTLVKLLAGKLRKLATIGECTRAVTSDRLIILKSNLQSRDFVYTRNSTRRDFHETQRNIFNITSLRFVSFVRFASRKK